MKTPFLIILLLATSLGGGFVAKTLFSEAPASPDGSALVKQLDVERDLRALRDEIAELRRGLVAMEAGAGLQAQPEPMPEAQLRELVAEAVAAHMASRSPADLTPSAAALRPDVTTEDLLGQLDDAKNELERELLWKEIRDAGRMDEVLAYLEEAVAAAPGDHDLAVALGVAYLEKIQDVGQGPLAGVYATKADQTFDAVLEADPRNWDARFTKAIALTFWPPVFGKQGEAVKNFEILAEQQRSMSYDSGHGETWMLLGNMYQQMGQADKATDAWIEGYELYPDHGGLEGKILEGH